MPEYQVIMENLRKEIKKIETMDLIGATIFAAIIVPLIIVLVANIFELASRL